MGSPVVHFELWSKNPQRIGDFYAKALGWEVSHVPQLNYWLVRAHEEGIGGGIMKPQEGPWPGNMCLYAKVPRLAPALARVREAGGKVVVERMDVPEVGAFALFEDPDGRVLGLWEQNEPTVGTASA